MERIENISGVAQVAPPSPPYKLAAKSALDRSTTIRLGDVTLGSDEFVVMAGPCTVEGPEQMMATARGVRQHGAHVLRGGAYKPRSSPYSFQGLGEEGLKLLRDAKAESGLPIITEVMEPGTVDCPRSDVQTSRSCSSAGRDARSKNGSWRQSTS